MLSRQLLRERFEEVSELLTLRGTEPGMLDEWRRLDRDRRATLVEVENLKNQRNEASKAIGKIKQGGGDAAEEIAQVASLKGEVEALENCLAAVDGELRHVELRLSNVPDSSVPHGADEGANRVERVVGTPAVRDFEPKPHWEVGTIVHESRDRDAI